MGWSWAGALQGAGRSAGDFLSALERDRNERERQREWTVGMERQTRLDDENRAERERNAARQAWLDALEAERNGYRPKADGSAGSVEMPIVLPPIAGFMGSGGSVSIPQRPSASSAGYDPSKWERVLGASEAERQAAAADEKKASEIDAIANLFQQAPTDPGARAQLQARGKDLPKRTTPVFGDPDYEAYQASQLKDFEKRQQIEARYRPPSPAATQMGEQRAFQREQSLQADYANDPTVKQAKAYASAYAGILAAAKSNDAQSNLALMYEAVKMRDPNAVREGELALQKSARSVPEWMRQYWNKAATGNVLSETERQQIVNWAGEKIHMQRSLVEPIQQRAGEAARRAGVDSAYVAPDPFAGINKRPKAWWEE